MSGNKLTGTIPSELGRLPLGKLHSATFSWIVALLLLRPAEILFLDQNFVEGTVPRGLCYKLSLTDIRVDCHIECICRACM